VQPIVPTRKPFLGKYIVFIANVVVRA
jgi:hypothetical protein